MTAVFPEIQVGDPIHHGGLDVFPLFGSSNDDVLYDLFDEAISRGSVAVEEISESGSVPELSVDNLGDLRVLFLEGEELVGAKQNRILNTSVLIAARTKSKIPVSCVEAGRWRYRSRQFGSSGSHSSYPLRHAVKASVSRSVRAQRGHRSDQGEVWDEVARQQEALGASSGTSAMSDTFEQYQQRLEEYRKRLHYVEGAIGAAVAVNGKVLAIDLFDRSATCSKVWDRLLSGVMLDALESQQAESPQKQQTDRGDVERTLKALGDLSWSPADSVGEGEEYRAETSSGDHASALVLNGTLVHGSVVCAP